MERDTLHGALIVAAKGRGEKAALSFYRDGWRHVTCSEFLRSAGAVAARLNEAGVTGGERVALVAENRREWCTSYLGILMAGAVAVPIDARLTPGEIGNILTDSGARCVIYTDATGKAVSEGAGGLSLTALDLDGLDWSTPEGWSLPDVEDRDGGGRKPASLLYTSGTTATPKAVMLTHENLLSDALAVIDTEIMSERDRVLSILPLHHTYPFMCAFVVPMLVGAAITYPAGLKGPEIISAIKETGVTLLVGVPQLLELMFGRIMARIGGLPRPLSWAARRVIGFLGGIRRRTGLNIMKLLLNPMGRQFRFFISGGARLDPQVMTGLEALGFTVIEGYGLTETSPIVCFNPPHKRKPGSVGMAVPSAEIKIIPHISAHAQGEGEIAVRGPMVMEGYYRMTEETAQVLADGWFRTGDLGCIDSEGYLFVTGRLKEVIVLASGKNVYPEEVERRYRQSPLIKELCVMEQGGRLKAVIVPDMAEAMAIKVGNITQALKWQVAELSTALPPHMRIMGYTISTEPLPRTPLGKLRRFLIAGRLEAEDTPPREDDRALMEDSTGLKVVETLRPFLEEGAVPISGDNLELDLGLDSLRRLELVVSLERAFSVKFPQSMIAEAHTVGELVAAIRELGERVGPAGAGEEDIAEGLEAVLSREPSEVEKRRAGFTRGVLDWPLTVVLRALVKLLLKVFFRVRVSGAENLPQPPFIIASNHASYLDGFVIATGMPRGTFRNLFSLGEKKYFIGRLSSLFARLAHVISIDPDSYLNRALELSSFVLRSGGALMMFPEGGRSFDGELGGFKKGIGILSIKLGVPVLPVRVEGTFHILPRGAGWPRPGRIRLTFGRPIEPSGVDIPLKSEGRDRYMFFADEVRRRVLELKSP